MSDLAERLRDWVKSGTDDPTPLCAEAADEIERLAAALWHAREDLAHLVQQIDAALNIQHATGNPDDRHS